MINIDYETWKNVCKTIFEKSDSLLSNYLQWYPFINLSFKEKHFLQSEEFFTKLIKNGAIFYNNLTFDFPRQYIQKSNSSFRNIQLISPVIFLYLESIGYQISKKYSRESKTVRCYYAGNLGNLDFHYKESYDKFFADINYSSNSYKYYYKFDVANFFDSIDINLLFDQINHRYKIVDPRSALIYKRLLQSIGNGKFPTVENSASLSYLATYIYLDKVDKSIEDYLESNSEIKNFTIIRYVDDVYILFNTRGNRLNNVLFKMKNHVINEYRKIHLSLNENKSNYGETKNIGDALNSALYDHYVNSDEIDISSLFDKENVINFLKNVSDAGNSINHSTYKAIKDEAFDKPDIYYSSDEVFRYLVFYNKDLFKDKKVLYLLWQIIKEDYNIIKYNTTDFMSMMLNTNDGSLIRYMLNIILSKSGLDSFDISISINYLLKRNFQHKDLINKIGEIEPGIKRYINYYCRTSFISSIKKIEHNNFLNLLLEDKYLFNNDNKVWFIYLMYKIHRKNNDTLEYFSYYKTYFDRMTSLLMHYKNIRDKKGRPTYKEHYKVVTAKEDYYKLNENYYNECDIGNLLTEIYRLRNFNPINHSSAELIEDEMLNVRQIDDLIGKAELLLKDSFN